MSEPKSFYATCATGLDTLLADELRGLGLAGVDAAGAGVRFLGPLSAGYRACLWSRVANRVLLPVHAGQAATPEALYALVREIDWSAHLRVTDTLAVDFFSASSGITHTQYGALKVKDAIVDQFREATGQRPSVDRDEPAVRVNVYVFRNQARIAIDLSGNSLHRRGYRQTGGPAPLKENLAAALLLAMDWPARAARGESLVDPLCGSGTFLIEAAMMACHRAPGLGRDYFGFLGWQGHDTAQWQSLIDEARAAIIEPTARLTGYDQDARAVSSARQHAMNAGVGDRVTVEQRRIGQAIDDEGLTAQLPGLVMTNPPYGERLAAGPELYADLGEHLGRVYAGWDTGLFTAASAPHASLRLPLAPSLQVKNGGIDCVMLSGRIPSLSRAEQTSPYRKVQHDPQVSLQVDAQPFVNRLAKNRRSLKGWLKQNGVSAYRLYDADLPEFAVAIDVYECDERQVVVQEYQAPASINPGMAKARLDALLAVLPEALKVPVDAIHLKHRERQSGKSQYEKADAGRSVVRQLTESGERYEVNLSDYVDTGLFLDHRPVRRYIGKAAAGKRFLNLFAYTAAATVSAVAGGARSSVSVDLSKRYCEWARRNLDANDADPVSHQVVRQDVLSWLAEASGVEPFDLILLDPPTFSNSTGLDEDWNVQRDHEAAIDACMALLAPGGTLVFSNNYRRFKPGEQLTEGRTGALVVEDRSRWSIDRDFQRSPRVHRCWFIKRAAQRTV